jgi:serine/threonine-protein kinase
MRFVDGVPLSRCARDDVRRLVAFVRDAALAVQHAHEQGVVHRDLKPANLLIEGDRVVVTDFGLAKDAAAAAELSLSGHVLGTPAYMSPEQAKGRVREVDPRTDVWGLGATLYDLLAGRPPFPRADVPGLLRAVVEEDPRPVRALAPGVPRDLERVVMKCLEKEKERRYASARELADDLGRWLDGEPVRAQPPSFRYRLGKLARKRRGVLLVAGASAAAIAVAVGFALSERAQHEASGEALALSQEIASVIADAQMHARLGEIELRTARLEEGIAACRAFLARHDVPQARALLGRLLRTHGRPEEARIELDRAIEADPALVEARLERGLLAIASLGPELARERPPAGLDETERMSAEQRAILDTALADLAAAAERPASLRASDALLARAELLRLRGERAAARAAFEEALRVEPMSVEAWIALSELHLVEGDTQAATKAAMSAVDLFRGFGPAYLARAGGTTAAAPGPASRALAPASVEGVEGLLADLGAALRSSPSDATAHANRGLTLARRAAQLLREGWPDPALEVWGSAADACRSALVLEAELLEARNNLGIARSERARLLDRLGRPAEARAERLGAIGDLDLVVGAAPSDPIGWLNRGMVRARAGEDGGGAAGSRADLARARELAGEPRIQSAVEGVIAAAALSPSAR